MIEPEDFMILGTSALQNQLRISDFGTPDRAVTDLIASRMTELQSRPIPGAYDAIHLRHIHAHIFQDLFPWAGQLRISESSSSLDTLFDRLARENRLRGLDPDIWSKRSTEYFAEIAAIEPFIGGAELASLEFFRELACENNLTLRWTNAMSEPFHDEMQSHLRQTQSNNIRRILMLAVDPYPSSVWPNRDLERHNLRELIGPHDSLF